MRCAAPNALRMATQLTMPAALRVRPTEAHTYCWNQGQGLHERIHLLYPGAVHLVRRLTQPTVENRPLHLPALTVRSRAHTNQQRAHIGRAICEVLLRGVGQIRSGSEG